MRCLAKMLKSEKRVGFLFDRRPILQARINAMEICAQNSAYEREYTRHYYEHRARFERNWRRINAMEIRR